MALRQPVGVPVVGLTASLFGTALAVYLVPEDIGTPGQLQVASLVQAAGFLAGSVMAATYSLRLLFRSEHLYMVGLVYWVLMDTIQGRYGLKETTSVGVVGAFTSLGLFAAAVWFVQLLPPLPLPRVVRASTHVSLTPALLGGITCVCFGLGIFHYAFTSDFNPERMASGLLTDRFSAPWVLYRMQSGGVGSWMAISEQMVNFGYLLPCLVVLTARRTGILSLQTVLAAALTATYLPFVAQGGGRRVLGAALGAALLVYLLTVVQIRVRTLLFAVLLLASLLIMMELIVYARGSEQGLGSVLDDSPAFRGGLVVRVDDNFLRLAQVTTLFPERLEYLYEQRIWFTITRPVPRVLWPGKPSDPGFELAGALGLRGFSLSTSVVGEWYTVLGYIGVVFGGMVYGLLGGVWNQLLTGRMAPSAVLVYAFGLMVLFVGLRSMDDLMFQSYALLAWLFLTSFVFRRIGDRRD